MANANTFELSTVVNNLPEELDVMLHDAYQCQREFPNETDFRMSFLRDALVAQTKYVARGGINSWEALISKCQKLHKEFNRDQAIDFLRKTRTGKEMEEISTVAEVVKQKLS